MSRGLVGLDQHWRSGTEAVPAIGPPLIRLPALLCAQEYLVELVTEIVEGED